MGQRKKSASGLISSEAGLWRATRSNVGGYCILVGAFLVDSLYWSIAGTRVALGLPTAQGAGVMVVLSVEIIEAKEEREAFFFFPLKIVREKGDGVAKTLKRHLFQSSS